MNRQCGGVGDIDTGFEFAHFAVYTDGQIKRLLTLEDDELVEDGFPVEAERGQQMNDFDEQEAERLWTAMATHL